MFESVRNNKRIVQVILGLITLSFAFFGIESYLNNAGKVSDVATVGGSPISGAEFDRALREQQDRMRNSGSEKFDDATFRSVEFRQAVLDNLINQRLLALHAAKGQLAVGDRQLQAAIAEIPAFQADGRFDAARYAAVLSAQGMNQPMFEARLRQDLAIRQILEPVAEGALAPSQATASLLRTQLEQREIRVQEIRPTAFLSKVDLGDAAVKEFYDGNPSLFERPARIRAEYVVLDAAAVESGIQVSDEEIKKWYDAHQDKYVSPEERRASHILVQVAGDAPEGEVAKAKAAIEGIQAQVTADPTSFGRLAKEKSQDPGSAGNEGDLGFFGRGVMVKAFEDATFGLQKAGEVSGVVRSDFGFHIIRLTAIKPAKGRPLEEVGPEIRSELRKQALSKRLAEMAEAFSNMVYEQPDSLAPVVERFKLKVQQSDWVNKGSDALGAIKSSRLVDALFSDDAIAKHRNTEAIDVGGGTLVAARVLNHEPAHRLSLDEAKGQIEILIRSREASKLALTEGQGRLEALSKGESVQGEWSAARVVQRSPGLPRELLKVVFGLPAEKLPAYAGYQAPDGTYALIKLEKVTKTDVKPDDPRLQAVNRQYQQLLGRLELNGYLAQLRSRYGVEVSPQAVRGDSAE
jgi:peptidyl-prolyl cis-trans isomerase D